MAYRNLQSAFRKTAESGREYICMGVTLIIAFVLFWFLPPLFSYDSAWYLTYTDYFSGNAPWTSWNAIRGFTFPFILWIARVIYPGPGGVWIVLCAFYMLFGVYIFRILRLVKKSLYNKKINIPDCLFVFIFALMSSILYGYYHYALTECIAVSMLTVYLFHAIKFYLDRKTQETVVTKRRYFIFLVFSCVMTVLFWFLKQSFVANTVFIVAFFELLVWIDRLTWKKAIYSFALAVSIVVSLKGSINIWNRIIDNDHNYTSSFANRLSYMRYIVPENLRKGGQITVMDDDWNVIDSFEYTYDNTFSSVLEYWFHCLVKYPGRVMAGYADNYLLIADLFQDPNSDSSMIVVHKQGPVIRDRIWQTISGLFEGRNMAGEHVALVRNRLLYGYNNKKSMLNTIEMLDQRGYPTSMLENYYTVSPTSYVTRFLGSNGYWAFTTFVYALLLVAAPFVCIGSFLLYVIKGKNAIYGICSALSFYSFLFILMHVVEGMNIDRYAVPSYGAMLVLLIVMLSAFTEKLQSKIMESKKRSA